MANLGVQTVAKLQSVYHTPDVLSDGLRTVVGKTPLAGASGLYASPSKVNPLRIDWNQVHANDRQKD
jgi:hypothetical protein